jgi:alpha-glucosidase
MYTLLSSHDIPRAIFRLKGDVERYTLAYALLFAFPGSPAIYYGDEVGLSQPNPYAKWQGDPYCRAPFPWEESAWNLEVLTLIRRLVKLKRTHPALRLGGLLPLEAGKGVLAFRRRYQGQEIWAFFAPEGARLTLPPGIDLIAEKEVAGEVETSFLLFQPV